MKAILFIFPLLFLGAFGQKQIRKFKNSIVRIDEDEVKMVTEGDSVSFFVIGDWGGLPVYPYRTIIEEAVSNRLTEIGKRENTQFQLALGDNFYFHGVNSSEDKRFRTTFEDVFKSEHLKNTSWFVLLGNHDHYGNASAQIDYTALSHRWIIPSFNYTIDVKPEGSDDNLITIMMIDTVLMCGNTGYDWQTHQPPQLNSVWEKLLADIYFRGFEDKLKQVASSNVPYILVAGHFPVWSIAEHGPTKCLLDKLRPLLHKYNVSAYFCGHDHNLQLIEDTYLNHTVQYIVSGSANFVDQNESHKDSIPPNSLKFYWADNSKVVNGGFNIVKANRQNMTITFVETNGKELYQTVIFPRV